MPNANSFLKYFFLMDFFFDLEDMYLPCDEMHSLSDLFFFVVF